MGAIGRCNAWFTGAVTLVALVATSGCGGEGAVCGPGTVRVDGTCLADDHGSAGAVADADAGPRDVESMTAPDGGPVDTEGGDGGDGTVVADAGTGGTPPGADGGYAPPPGCDAASGECAAWEASLLDGLRSRQAAAGCTEELVAHASVDRVAQRHAEYQAGVDRLDPTSPDGDLFEQIEAEGVSFTDGGLMFSVTRSGAEDVLTRWEDNPDVAPLLERCGYATGVGIATSGSGATYVTVLIVNET